MGYEKPEDEHEKGSTKYYIDKPKEQTEEKTDLPTFQQIFSELPTSGSIASFSAFNKGIVYFSSLDTHVYALDAGTGEMLWKFKTGAPAVSTPLIHHDRIYFGSNDRHFYCLDLDGKLIWKKNTGDIIVSSAIGIGNKIFIGNGSGYFFCFSSDGNELWRFRTGDGIMAIPSTANGMIFVSSYDKNVYALDLEGNLRWKFTAGERGSVALIMSDGKNIFSANKRSWDKEPYAENFRLYCGSYDNYLYCLDIVGNVLWKFNCGTSVPGGIGGDNGTVYAGTISGVIYAIDALSGNEKWSFRTGGMITAGAEISNRKVYFTSFDQKLYCLSEKGEKLWDFMTGGPIISRPFLVGNKVYFGSFDTLFYCIDEEKRSVDWTFRVGFGMPDSSKSLMQNIVNVFTEYDRKIFRVWVPETAAKEIPQINTTDYTAKLGLDSTFAYGGLGSYLSKGRKKDAYGR